jgi:hypothetical protein
MALKTESEKNLVPQAEELSEILPTTKDEIRNLIDQLLPYFPESNKSQLFQEIKNLSKEEEGESHKDCLYQTVKEGKRIIKEGVNELNNLKKHKLFDWKFDGYMLVQFPPTEDNKTIILWPSSSDKKLYRTSYSQNEEEEITIPANDLEIFYYLPFFENQLNQIKELVASHHNLAS